MKYRLKSISLRRIYRNYEHYLSAFGKADSILTNKHKHAASTRNDAEGLYSMTGRSTALKFAHVDLTHNMSCY